MPEDLSFDLTPEQRGKLQKKIDAAKDRKLLFTCSVKDGKLIVHAIFYDSEFIAANSPFGPPTSGPGR
jgi:hypothetical protein